MVQFKEHESGKQQTDSRIQKLDKLARLLKVHIHVDGVSYGLIPETTPSNILVTETVKKVYQVDTGDLPVEEAKQFVEDNKPVSKTVVEEVVEEAVDQKTEEPTKTTTEKPKSTTKRTKSTKTS